MLAALKRLLMLQLRRNKRYKAKEGLCVVYDRSMSMNQIDTLSMGGLSFYYVDRGMQIERGSYNLSIFNRNKLCLRNVPFKAVSDQASGEILTKRKTVKRQSVRFGKLTRDQKRRLKILIAKLTE
ncbi:MAG: hypothetical protein QNJ22_09770 [Desulfosarcinaceae bacterium]|nr:hypothetical protein [Desulfosarcinaceae bacterium]